MTATTASIGMILPFDSALDREFWQYVPDSVDLFLTRTPHVAGPLGVPLMAAVSEPASILSAAADMAVALDPDVVVYACTSGSFLRGLDACRQLRADIEAAGCRRGGSTSEFVLDALELLGAGRVAVAAPYDDEMTGLLLDFLREAGHDPVSFANLGMTGDPKTVDPQRVLGLARAADSPTAEALILSCTNLRTFELVPMLESELGKPVLTSNQVSVWGALVHAGAPMPEIDHALFKREPPQPSPPPARGA
jgi:maleate isomerase